MKGMLLMDRLLGGEVRIYRQISRWRGAIHIWLSFCVVQGVFTWRLVFVQFLGCRVQQSRQTCRFCPSSLRRGR
jgi:hypothetical protein